MNIVVIGTGYVGLVAGTCLSDFGNTVVCVDNDKEKIYELNDGKLPIYEPGLEELVSRNVKSGRLSFSTDIANAVTKSDVVFIAVGTPPQEDGCADLTYVLEVADAIGACMTSYKVIVDKSTVPIGTAGKVREVIQQTLTSRKIDVEFDVVSNPEFLREGSAIHDFTHPDRVVIGVESIKAKETMQQVYRVLFLNEIPFVVTDIASAELIKYAANAFLAMKISYINQIANLCEAVGANVHDVARGIGKDNRIGSKFLHPGPGYGGSCFPKDTLAIVKTAADIGCPLTLIEETIRVNHKQRERMINKILTVLGDDLRGVTLGVLGLTYKPNTDDMRESPSLTILPALIQKGARLKVYDPQGRKEFRLRFGKHLNAIDFAEDEYDAVEGVAGVILLTEWNQFRNMNIELIKTRMTGNVFFDLRNIYDQAAMSACGFNYYSIGRPV